MALRPNAAGQHPAGAPQTKNHPVGWFVFGGARRDRTADLNTASVALSQLSYGPIFRRQVFGEGRNSTYPAESCQASRHSWIFSIPTAGENGALQRAQKPVPSTCVWSCQMSPWIGDPSGRVIDAVRSVKALPGACNGSATSICDIKKKRHTR